MVPIKLLFGCSLAAVLQGSQSSFVDFFSRRSLGPLEGNLGPSLPEDSVYVPFRTCRNHFMLSRAAGGTVDASSEDDCRAAATAKGAHAYWFTEGVCELATLRHALCSTRAKNFNLHLLQEFLSNGTDSDGAVLPEAVVTDILGTPTHTSFRIESPTVVNVRGVYRPLKGFQDADESHVENFVLLKDNGAPMKVHRHVIADPACYTNSTCGVPFFSSTVQEPNAKILILHDVCSQRIPMKGGQVYYLLSHAGLGCEPYPQTYPEPGCSVLFRGFRNYGSLKARVTLTDFKGRDRCGGQYLKLTTFEGHTRSKNNVCRRHQGEISTQEGRIRITLGGSATTNREKYGFIIKLSY